MSLRQHAEGIFGWSRFQPDRGYDFNGTALVGAGAAKGTVLLIDPVPATVVELEALSLLGQRFDIVLLNADHERDAAAFAKFFDAPIYVARADHPSLKLHGALPFDENHEFPGGWIAHTLPDLKTPGESVLHNPARRIAVIGDAVIADPLTGLRLVPPAKIRDRAAALASLGRLVSLDFDGLFTGDGFVLPSGGRTALERFLVRETAR